jgi:polar amino acid transport system substrate-binding protein
MFHRFSYFAAYFLLAFASVHAHAQDKADIGDCEISGKTAPYKLSTHTPGALTIAGPIAGSPNGYQGPSVDAIRGGDLFCIAVEIASRAGLKRVIVQNLPWDALVTAKVSNFDLSVFNVAITEQRQKVVDFSKPYRLSYPVALVRSNRTFEEKDMANATVGVLIGAAKYPEFLRDVIKPKEVKQFSSIDDIYNAVNAGQIDVAFNDYSNALQAAKKSNGRLKAVARFPVSLSVGVLFPKGSANVDPVDKILDDMRADGTMKRIETKWLIPVLGMDPEILPEWGVSK